MTEIYYLLFSATGILLAYFYGNRTKKFLWREYIAILIAPITGLGALIASSGLTPLYVFVTGFILGPFLEWIGGLLLYKILGSPLWVYERYTLPGRYTSFLAAPFWGMIVLLFWFITKNF